MNAQDLLKQRMLEALVAQDSSNKQGSGNSLPIDQASQFQQLPPDLQQLATKGGQQAGQSVTAGFSPLSDYMRDANRENVDAKYQDYAADAAKSSDDIKWEKLKALLGSKASQ